VFLNGGEAYGVPFQSRAVPPQVGVQVRQDRREARPGGLDGAVPHVLIQHPAQRRPRVGERHVPAVAQLRGRQRGDRTFPAAVEHAGDRGRQLLKEGPPRETARPQGLRAGRRLEPRLPLLRDPPATRRLRAGRRRGSGRPRARRRAELPQRRYVVQQREIDELTDDTVLSYVVDPLRTTGWLDTVDGAACLRVVLAAPSRRSRRRGTRPVTSPSWSAGRAGRS
jgi:hypothetical protein